MSDIKKIKIEDIDEFKNHPFNVNQDESLNELAVSIKENGLLNPIIVRPKGERYEVVSGHRRLKATELNGEDVIDAYIKDLNNEEAIIYMVDSNLQREYILPSEKHLHIK
jgi:ParB family chromosome partitioning protein